MCRSPGCAWLTVLCRWQECDWNVRRYIPRGQTTIIPSQSTAQTPPSANTRMGIRKGRRMYTCRSPGCAWLTVLCRWQECDWNVRQPWATNRFRAKWSRLQQRFFFLNVVTPGVSKAMERLTKAYCTSTPEANWATKSPEVDFGRRVGRKLFNFMQMTMTRFSGQTLTANRNVDALRLRGTQGTPAGTLVPTYLYSLTEQNVGWSINRGCNWAPGVVRPNPFSVQRSKRHSGLDTKWW